VKSQTTSAFRKLFSSLPVEIRVFAADPHHPSLHFKRVHETEPVFSARVGRSYRVVGLREEADLIVWFWIGPHEKYETLLANL